MESNNKNDVQEIDNLTNQFFSVFNNTNNHTPNLDELKNIFIKEGMIINNSNGEPQIFNLDDFIKPRAEILTNGALTDFKEREISNKTLIFQNVAQRFSLYEKSGKLDNKYFKSEGMKTIQFIKVGYRWKMSSVAWSDKI